MKISFNFVHTGKFPEEFSNGLDRKQINLWWKLFNNGFENIDIGPVVAAEHIMNGHPFSSQHFGIRAKRNFLCGQHVAIDFDTGTAESSFAHLEKMPIVQNYGTIIYSTPSHSEEHPKSRVFFQLDRPIYQVDKYSLLLEAINIQEFGKIADTKCHDPARFFFGSNGNVKFLGNVLPVVKAYHEIIAPYVERKLKEQERKLEEIKNSRLIEVRKSTPLLDHIRERLIQKIYDAPDGEKHFVIRDVSRTFGGYIASGYFDQQEIEVELKQAIANRGAADLYAAYQTIDQGISYGKQDPLYIYDNTYTIDDLIEDTQGGGMISPELILQLGTKKNWS